MSNRDPIVEKLIENAIYRGPTVTGDQLVGVDACIRQLEGQLALAARPELAERFRLEPSGTLFIGPPGTGKTLLARYLAGRLGAPLYQVSADQFGGDPELLHGVFRRLASERAVLFIDEVSILAQRRETTYESADRLTLAALLTELDGLSANPAEDRLWVVAACTPDIDLDPAIYRAGRLGVVIEFAKPSEYQRRQLFELYLRGVPHRLRRSDIARLARICDSATGADVRDWVSQAASLALGERSGGEPVIRYRHLEAVVARRGFVAAEDRPGREPTWQIAVHEAAHAVISFFVFGPESLGRLHLGFGTLPGGGWNRGHFLSGHFGISAEWLAVNQPTSESWPDHVAVDLAGACAEQALLGYRGAGAEADVQHATRLILDQLDMADPALGPSRHVVETVDRSGVAGSEVMRTLTWELVRERFGQCWQRTTELVTEHRTPIEELAKLLLDSKATWSGEAIVAMLEGPGEAAA